MHARVQKWGNSLALRVPKAVAEMMLLADGSEVELELQQGRLVVTPVREAELTLDALLAQVTDQNLHGEVDWGPAAGQEVW
jgi:antitoxin MazE